MPDIEGGVQDSTTSDSEDLTLLNEEPESPESRMPSPAPPKEKEDEEEPDKSDEEESSEEKKKAAKSEEEDEDEKDRGAKPPVHDRPSMQQLREAFPDLFKKFPSLRDIYYREQEFSQIFPTVEDAKEASSNATAFQDVTDKVLAADAEGIFNAIKETDSKAFLKIAENVLPTLYKISPDIHWKATVPLMQNLVRGFYLEGERRKDENVKNAADYLSDFVFGDVKVARGERDLVPKPSQTESEELKNLNSEKAKFLVDRIDSFTRSIKTQADDALKRAVTDGSKHDPDDVFSDFIKETIVGKVMQEIDRQLTADRTHMQYMNSLWEKAKKDSFSDDWKSRILSAYLARAKSLVPSVRAKFVSEARGTSSKSSAKTREIHEKNVSRREPGTSGRDSKPSNGHLDAKRIDWSKTSDLDLLEDRVTFRK